MIVELRKKSQITVPKEIVNALNLAEGDHLEITLKDGLFTVEPVEIYSKNYVDKLEKTILQIREDPEKYSVGPFKTIEEALEYLHSEEDEDEDYVIPKHNK